MTLACPMFPPAPEDGERPIIFPQSIATAAPIARRGFLWGLVRLAPVAAFATATAPPAAASPPLSENSRLLWLGEQLEAIDAAFDAAAARKTEARAAADRQWPEPPAAITFNPGVREPDWCSIQPERDIDNKTFYKFGNKNDYRKVADAFQLKNLWIPDGRTREARQAKKLLAIAREYETSREAVIESTGYGEAREALYLLARRIDRIATLIYKCEARTYRGLTIKARALIVGVKMDVVDDYIAHRSKVVYADKLAESILGLSVPR
jgi:hypothetical protein